MSIPWALGQWQTVRKEHLPALVRTRLDRLVEILSMKRGDDRLNALIDFCTSGNRVDRQASMMLVCHELERRAQG